MMRSDVATQGLWLTIEPKWVWLCAPYQ